MYQIKSLWIISLALATTAASAQQVVPGYTPPVAYDGVTPYADDTRGVYVPEHGQHRMRTPYELQNYNNRIDKAQAAAQNQQMHRDRLVQSQNYIHSELDRIAQGQSGAQQPPHQSNGQPYPPTGHDAYTYDGRTPGQPYNAQPAPPQPAQPPYDVPQMGRRTADGGVELAVAESQAPQHLDLNNSVVRLREERISVRRALQRMMDQVGGGHWTIVWDLGQTNVGLPDMEISVYAEEPFMNVLNALLARLQTRAGDTLRVIKYDQTQRLVITDQVGGHMAQTTRNNMGIDNPDDIVVTERLLNETEVSLHYDEIPLVDALEEIIQQAGKGQWRLRMYAGRDQMLKPAHVEEPFNVAMQRLLKLFNLQYEIFPGGKLVVITQNSRLGYGGMR